jgi:hypothetical protein
VDADLYVFMDTDLAADLSTLPVLIEKVQGGYDVVTGSRYCEGARVSRPPLRMLTSLVYNWLVNQTFRDNIRDHQCGFKAFSRRAVRGLLPKTRETTWFWDTEVLVLALRLGYMVAEVPVTWTETKLRRTPIWRSVSDIVLHGRGLLRLKERVRVEFGTRKTPGSRP